MSGPMRHREAEPRPLALVTGASRGIGAEVARALAATHDVLLGGRDTAVLHTLADELPGARPWPVELTDSAELAEAVGGIEYLDVLVHSAGVALLGSVAETPAEQWRRQFDVNVVAVAELTRLLLPALRAARGRVVLLNALAGIDGDPGWGGYAASKQALRAFADTLRSEEQINDVRVTTVFAGRTDTPTRQGIVAAAGEEYQPDRYLRPESVAGAVLVAVTAPDDAVVDELHLRPPVRH